MHEAGVHDRWGGPRAIFQGTLYLSVTHTNTVYKILSLVIVRGTTSCLLDLKNITCSRWFSKVGSCGGGAISRRMYIVL